MKDPQRRNVSARSISNRDSQLLSLSNCIKKNKPWDDLKLVEVTTKGSKEWTVHIHVAQAYNMKIWKEDQ